MMTLYIDTHLWNIVIILFKDGKVYKKEEVVDKKNNSEFIFPTIQKVLDNEQFDNIIVVNGPGSFTGVRLGVTIAKTLAYVKSIPIRTISALECLAVSSDIKNVAISDGNGFFVGTFNEDNTLNGEYSYLSNDEFLELSDIKTDVTIDYEKVYEYALNKESMPPHLVNPIYIKKIGVEK